MEKWVLAAKRADFQEIGRKYGIDPVIARKYLPWSSGIPGHTIHIHIGYYVIGQFFFFSFSHVEPPVLLFNVLVVIPDAILQCIFTAARPGVPAS